VRIRESDEVWIDNNIARIRMRADLGIIGSAARPNLTGRISVVKGYILFIDRKFKIEDGTIDFIDPNRLNPVITLKAATRVTSYREMEATPYTVTLSVTGPLDEAAVELYSEPPLDRANIVSLLTLGVTREQLSSGGEGGDVSTGGILVDRAKALTSDRVGGYISRNVEDLLQLDQVTIEGNLFDFESSWGPQLLASKKISDRTTVTYRTNVGHLNDRSVMLDYRLTERFSLSGETDQYGRSGIDLKFTIRLK
jgi:autotransporter translocation and assembly factor TamB